MSERERFCVKEEREKESGCVCEEEERERERVCVCEGKREKKYIKIKE